MSFLSDIIWTLCVIKLKSISRLVAYVKNYLFSLNIKGKFSFFFCQSWRSHLKNFCLNKYSIKQTNKKNQIKYRLWFCSILSISPVKVHRRKLKTDKGKYHPLINAWNILLFVEKTMWLFEWWPRLNLKNVSGK